VTATVSPAGPRTFAQAEQRLAASLPGYTPRSHQQALAAAIERSVDTEGILVAEAGTGTGKSLAALIAGILSGKRTVVATATKALQNQYTDKDLPFLQEHLGVEFTYALLKGRSNYPCAQKINDLEHPTPSQGKIIAQVAEAGPLDIIDRDDLPTTSNREWQQLSMTSDECPGSSSCPFASAGNCHSYRAKDKAAAADVVVTNTAYLAVDLKIRKQTDGTLSLLGDIEQLIVDEAHNLDNSITGALTDRYAAGTFGKLSGDAGAWLREAGANDLAAAAFGHAARELWNAVDVEFALWQARRRELREDDKTMPITEYMRLVTFGEQLAALGTATRTLWEAVHYTRLEGERVDPAVRKLRNRQNRLDRRLTAMLAKLETFVTDDDTVTIRWAEVEDDKLFLRAVPVSPAPFLNEMVWGKIPTVLMSATLAPEKDGFGRADFGYTLRSLGLKEHNPATFEAGTPFDYAKQALIYVPEASTPIPSGKTTSAWRAYTQQVTQFLVDASGGGALLLFTSKTGMEQAWNAMRENLEMGGLECLKQGDEPTPVLIRKFKADGNAVLFALRTFFEGVDIPGDALRLVILDKLPFPVPTDLMFAARCKAVNDAAGRDVSFNKLSMPVMSLPLVQAAGRLLRTTTDRGVIAILDPRLTSRGYGAKILHSLPPAPVTTDPREAAAFLKAGR
jgi:ATP-dependent DNA helicase DinG